MHLPLICDRYEVQGTTTCPQGAGKFQAAPAW